MLSTIPPMAVCGAVLSIVLSKMSSNEQKSYAKASEIVEQTIGSIRTVAAYTGENIAVQKYKKALNGAYISCIYEGLASGFGAGLVFFLNYSSYAFGMWNSSNLILNRGYTGGVILSVIFTVLIGAL
ncbi:ABC transporter B family member 11-like [Phalaenopsis equestris]|nr:ABC transporter B family member 11-like [Phalaenopsis equestris]